MPASARKPTILLIEDEPEFRMIYRDMFLHEGFTVLEADDGEKGWEMARTHLPDIILLDLVLPKLDGLGVLGNIRGDKSTNPLQVVIFSVMGRKEDIERGINAGANDYIVKGFSSPKEVARKVRAIITAEQATTPPPPDR